MLRLTRATRRLLAKLTLEGMAGRCTSGGGHQPQYDGTGGAARSGSGPAGHARMRRAIAGAGMARMTAEGDLLSVLVAAIGIAAVASFELDKRDQARPDTDAAQIDRFGRLQRRLRRQVQVR